MSRQRLARAIRDHAREQATSRQSVQRAIVVRRAPMRCEMVTGDLVLDIEQDFDLSAWLRFYDKEFKIAVGDTLLLHHDDGSYIAFDVQSSLPLRRTLVEA